MKRLLAILIFLIAAALVYLIDNDRHQVPHLGKMLSPSHGVWQNAVNNRAANRSKMTVKTPHGTVDVFYDERRVPHLFAPNEGALYFAQGYTQARDRLWQMEFQVRLAGGRLSEVLGPDPQLLTYDRYFRRIGIPKTAAETVDSMKNHPQFFVMKTYTDGVNQFIKELKPRNLPFEYKLADYRPEPWTVEKSVLLLKLMAFNLSGSDMDIQNTNTIRLIADSIFHELYPDYPTVQSPIIPVGTEYRFRPEQAPETPMDSLLDLTLISGKLPSAPGYRKGIGSNNWAVGKDKTTDGGAILCNDPHLGLSYPSIWYEMQLNCPGLNVYGVSIPGAPCIVIGFNESIAWGVTNAGRDVRDWYSIRFEDDKQDAYLFEGTFIPVEHRVETIEVKHSQPFLDTVKWTVAGPVVYDESFGKMESQRGLAMHWLANDVSNEMLTFYKLNKAENHEAYLEALSTYTNPAQNFAFADRSGNVAIKQQGKFRIRDEHRGKFIEPLEYQDMEALTTYIPVEHNPHVLNPPRGFISSANQAPTDSTYPYAYSGFFERYRNRRINTLLDEQDQWTVEDMKVLQNDRFNLMGEEMAPYLLGFLDSVALEEDAQAIVDSLEQWDYFNQAYASAPSYFQEWWKGIRSRLWDEFSDSTTLLRQPLDYETFEFLVNHPNHPLIDDQSTIASETVESIVLDAFQDMLDTLGGIDARWQYYNASSIEHLMFLDAFGTFDIPVGGSENAINANIGNFGPSWRMIVQLNEDGVRAYGVYPGGPSGNPLDPNYSSLVPAWTKGEYFDLNFYRSREEAAGQTDQP